MTFHISTSFHFCGGQFMNLKCFAHWQIIGERYVTFTNGHLKQEAAENAIDFKCFQANGKKNEDKKMLVAATDNLTYVGQNYGPTVPKVSSCCKYMLAVYNKKRGKVRLYDADMINMKPFFEGKESAEEKVEKKLSYMEKNDRLTEAFGSTKKRRAMESRHRNKLEQKVLETAVDSAVSKVMAGPGADRLTAPVPKSAPPTQIPPFDATATRPEDVYKLRDIISDAELEAVQQTALVFTTAEREALVHWRQQESFPKYIMSQLSILPIEENARRRKACCLMYLNYLITLFRCRVPDLKKKDILPSEAPDLVKKSILDRFTLLSPSTAPGGRAKPFRCMPARLKDSLASYILCLCLILDNFNLDFSLLMQDMRIGQQRMMMYLRALGCKVSLNNIKDPTVGDKMLFAMAKLVVPLKFPDVTFKRRKDKR